MSIRDLGDWSPLDLYEDPVYADPQMVVEAQARYQHIATTLEEAVSGLEKIVGGTSEGLNGQYIDALRERAEEVKDGLSKAAVRYRDVAQEIAKYEPDLDVGLRETADALNDAREAKGAQAKADGMPDPQKGDEGDFSAAEQQKGTDKKNAIAAADEQLAAAKRRLTGALDALDVAGKRFGDAVNCERYDDGLTDSGRDKLDAILKVISKVFGILSMIFTALALLIPGLGTIMGVLGLVAGAVTLGADATLFAHGEGELINVIFGAFGVALGGFALFAGFKVGGMIKNLGKGKPGGISNPGGPGAIELSSGVGAGLGSAGKGATGLPNWFTANSGKIIDTLLGGYGKGLVNLVSAGNKFLFGTGPGSLAGLVGLADIIKLKNAGGAVPVWLWAGTGLNALFAYGVSLIYTGMDVTDTVPE